MRSLVSILDTFIKREWARESGNYDSSNTSESIASDSVENGGNTFSENVTNDNQNYTTQTHKDEENLLAQDLKKYENYVIQTGLELNQNQFDALVSFTYNCGPGSLNTLIKNRSLDEIGEAILLYNKAGGKELPGLVRRRNVEHDLFFS